ncbi:MAG: class I SAM-dependent methyltransferase, partial [Acidimicrobiia bacterium]
NRCRSACDARPGEANHGSERGGAAPLRRRRTRRLEELVNFDVGSATELPYADESFDRSMLNHVGMNIADKQRLVREVRRVLRPGGLFAVYEQLRIGEGELPYPLPWADDEATSFVGTRTHYVELLADSGFHLEHEEDRTAANASGGPPPPGALGPGVLFGSAFAERLANNVAAASRGTLGAVLLVARAV